MHRRLNITLPEETVALIDSVAKAGDRSRLINEAVRLYIKTFATQNLRRRMREGARARADRDIAIALEWFPRDEKAIRRTQR
jgi:metal-responsive CopG/Arc/MetJ family transcriptional regulator